MKKFLSKLSLMKIITFIVVVAIIAAIVPKIPELSMKSSPIPVLENIGLNQATGKIDKDVEGYILIAQNGGKSLYMEPGTVNIVVIDDATGTAWKSFADGSAEGSDTAPIIIKYLNSKGEMSDAWDAYEYCIKDDMKIEAGETEEDAVETYFLDYIENGFRATFDMTKEDDAKLEYYMPKQISIKRYEECFLNKLEQFTDAEAKAKYERALGTIYAIDPAAGDHYYNKYAGTPPRTLTQLLIQFSKEVGYTREDLLSDSAEFGVSDIDFAQPANFRITVDVTLENGDLVVSIPSYEIKNNCEDPELYTLYSIAVFPNFGLVEAASYQNGGFIFVPDGSGALFEINSLSGGYASYERPFYSNNYYDILYKDTEYNEDLTMPVFGMGKKGVETATMESLAPVVEEASEEASEVVSEEANDAGYKVTLAHTSDAASNDTGFMGVIEKGAESAMLNVTLADAAGSTGTQYNKVYPTFNLLQYSNVKVFGPYSDSTATFFASTKKFDIDIKVRYKLYTEKCNYYTMAEDYRSYLVEKNGLETIKMNAPEIFLDVVSSLTLKDRIMGVPYDRTISMTTYNELGEILKDLEGVNKVVSYKGAYNGGIYNTLNDKADLTKANGSKSEYDALMAAYGDSIYMSTPISYVYKDNAVFNASKHGLLGYDSEAVEIYEYDIPTGRFNPKTEGHWIVSPYYLPGIVNEFVAAVDADNIAIEDLGNIVYAQYDPDTEVNLHQGEIVVKNAITAIAKDRDIILYNPFINRAFTNEYTADYVADISRESSDYGLVKHNIPFRQLVLNGLTKYTTLNVNESSSGKAYYLLQALELGSSPKYKITYSKVDELKENNYCELFATEYALIAEDIKNMSKTINAEFAKIGTTEIVNHEIVDDKVFKTTYATGAEVYVNYNAFDVTVTVDGVEKEIKAEGYEIVTGGAAEVEEPAAENEEGGLANE